MPRPRVYHPLLLLLALACAEDASTPTGPADGGEGPLVPRSPELALIVHNLTELPVPADVTLSEAEDINDQGQAVGTVRLSGIDRAVRWENGAIQFLGSLGGQVSFATGVNEPGQIVGGSQIESGQFRPFLWQNGSMQDLGTLGGVPINVLGSHATDVNNKGQVVGVSTTAAGEQHAFLWENGTMHDLGTLGGGTFSHAAAINERGQVVGFYQNSAFEQRAFLWENGVMQDLGTLGGAFGSAAGINELAQVTGLSVNGQSEQRAYLWENGVMTDLGALGGTPTSSLANDLNDLGQVVGSSPSFVAMVAMDGEMFGMGGQVANAINNRGQAVGRYINPAGSQRPTIWDVPIRPPTDLKPGDAGNTLSLKGRTVTLAILSTPHFSAQGVNPATVTLGDEQGTDTPVTRDRKGKPSATYRDLDGDGDKDLLLTFTTKEMIAKGDLKAGMTRLVLLGKQTDGRALRASDVVAVAP